MSRTLEDLLIWGEYCGFPYRDTEISCTRNEHQEDTPHQYEDMKWWSDGTRCDRETD